MGLQLSMFPAWHLDKKSLTSTWSPYCRNLATELSRSSPTDGQPVRSQSLCTARLFAPNYCSMCCRLCAEWHQGNPPPETIAVGSGKSFLWRCLECNHEYKARPIDRSWRKSGCPQCGNKARSLSSPRLRTLVKDERPDLAEEYDSEANSRPFESLLCGSNYRASWSCKTCKEVFQRTVVERARKDIGCPSCARESRIGNRPVGGTATANEDQESQTATTRELQQTLESPKTRTRSPKRISKKIKDAA